MFTQLGSPLASERVRLTEGEARRVRIQLSTGRLEVRVVDPQEHPLAGAIVNVVPAGSQAGMWRLIDDTDFEGAVRFGGVGYRSVHVAAYHPAWGSALKRDVRVQPDGSAEVTLALGGGEPLEVRLLEGSDAVAGVQADLCPFEPVRALVTARSDEDGILRFSRIGKGSYSLALRRAGFWSSTEAIEVDGPHPRIDLQVRRIGELVVEVRNSDGVPVSDRSVSLRPLDVAGSLSDWLRGGRIDASSTELRTDAQGELRVGGLPAGRFECSVELDGATRLEGTCRVQGGTTTRVVLESR